MRLEWLEDILAVAETGSFQDAAERRGLTQSAFSRRIRTIEDYVGADLFDRSRKPVHLLGHTEVLRDRIAHLARLSRQIATDLRRGERAAERTLVLSSQHSLTTSLVPRIVRHVGVDAGDLHIRLRTGNLGDCFGQLLSRTADILVVYRRPGGDHPILGTYIDSATLGTERLIPVLAPDSVGSLDASMEAGELAIIAYPADVFFGQILEREVLPQVRILAEPVAKAETALTLASIEMAALGIGVAWVPGSLVQSRISAGELADLSDRLPACDLEITVVRLAGDPDPLQAAIWDRLLAYPVAAARKPDQGHVRSRHLRSPPSA